MTCEVCARVAAFNRRVLDEGLSRRKMRKHPKNCECTCQHMVTVEWEDYYSVPRPGKEPQ